MTTQPSITPPTSDRDDVHCLRCGYNLHGLSGDPIRRPECDHENIVADLRLPPELLEQKLKDLCHAGEFAAMGIVMAAVPLPAWTWNGARKLFGAAMGFDIPITWRIGVVLMVIGLPLAWSRIRRFQTLRHGRHGWQQALVRYCMYGMIPVTWLCWSA